MILIWIEIETHVQRRRALPLIQVTRMASAHRIMWVRCCCQKSLASSRIQIVETAIDLLFQASWLPFPPKLWSYSDREAVYWCGRMRLRWWRHLWYRKGSSCSLRALQKFIVFTRRTQSRAPLRRQPRTQILRLRWTVLWFMKRKVGAPLKQFNSRLSSPVSLRASAPSPVRSQAEVQ